MIACRLLVALILLGFLPFLTTQAAAVNSESAPLVSFSAFDDRFEGPDTIPAGLVTIRLHNRGQDPHQLQLLRLAGGRTPKEFTSFIQRAQGRIPPWARHMGGPNGVGPGKTADAIVQLEPGTYVVTCAIPGKHQQSHALRKEPKIVRVVGRPAQPADFRGTVHMAMFEYEFVVIQDLQRGPQTFYVVNRGKQTHQVSLVQLDGGSSAEDMLNAFGVNGGHSLPGKLLGGMTGLEPGGRGMFTAFLSPGRYAMMCLFPDPSAPDGHAAKGMVMRFTIK